MNEPLADGGTSEEFEAAGPELRLKQRAERVMAAGNAARAEHIRPPGRASRHPL